MCWLPNQYLLEMKHSPAVISRAISLATDSLDLITLLKIAYINVTVTYEQHAKRSNASGEVKWVTFLESTRGNKTEKISLLVHSPPPKKEMNEVLPVAEGHISGIENLAW